MEIEQEIMKLEEAIRANGRRIWIQTRDSVPALPVTYAAERWPFLRFENKTLYLTIEVRAGYYGQTWRCFRKEPDRFDLAREWEEAENAE